MLQWRNLPHRDGVPQDHLLRSSRNEASIRRPGSGAPVVLMSGVSVESRASPPIHKDDFTRSGHTHKMFAVRREDGVVSGPGGIELISQRLSGRQIPGVAAISGVKDQSPAVRRKEQVIRIADAPRYCANLLPTSHPPQNRIAFR